MATLINAQHAALPPAGMDLGLSRLQADKQHYMHASEGPSVSTSRSKLRSSARPAAPLHDPPTRLSSNASSQLAKKHGNAHAGLRGKVEGTGRDGGKAEEEKGTATDGRAQQEKKRQVPTRASRWAVAREEAFGTGTARAAAEVDKACQGEVLSFPPHVR